MIICEHFYIINSCKFIRKCFVWHFNLLIHQVLGDYYKTYLTQPYLINHWLFTALVAS